jgi:hypothetical protein
MTSYERRKPETLQWALGIILVILLQTLAFTFWLGEINATVKRNSGLIDQIRQDLTKHMDTK